MFVSSAKSVRQGATHHPVCVTLRRCPPPYFATQNRDDSFTPHNKLIQSAQSAPKLATCNYGIRFNNEGKRERGDPPPKALLLVPLPILLRKTGMIGFAMHQRRGLVRGRPTTPPALHSDGVPLPIRQSRTGMIGFAILLHINKIGACAPKLATCNLQLATVTGMISFAITNNFFGRYIYGF